MPFTTLRLTDRISLIQETGVANFMRCNIWHVRGREFDLYSFGPDGVPGDVAGGGDDIGNWNLDN